jgi:hypothetical protein
MATCVISLHGIRTHGVWQKTITPLLSKKGWTVHPLDYGRFGLHKFCRAKARNAKIDWFRDEYTRIYDGTDPNRPSIIAHSFGTYIVAAALEKYEAIRFNKIIFCGSIVDPNYPWLTILNNDQAKQVRNDYGRLDLWSKLADLAVSDAGPSGAEGFKTKDPRIINKEFKKYKHSDYFNELHFRSYWIPFIEEPVLNLDQDIQKEQDKRTIVATLERVTKAVSQLLTIDQKQLRSNIFLPSEDKSCLKIPEGLHLNMRDPLELTIQIPVGRGCTGNAFQNKEPTIAVLEKDWGKYVLDEPEMKKVDKDLVWIFSMPIFHPDKTGRVIGVLNIDSLNERKTKEDIERIGDEMIYWSAIIADFLIKVWRDL